MTFAGVHIYLMRCNIFPSVSLWLVLICRAICHRRLCDAGIWRERFAAGACTLKPISLERYTRRTRPNDDASGPPWREEIRIWACLHLYTHIGTMLYVFMHIYLYVWLVFDTSVHSILDFLHGTTTCNLFSKHDSEVIYIFVVVYRLKKFRSENNSFNNNIFLKIKTFIKKALLSKNYILVTKKIHFLLIKFVLRFWGKYKYLNWICFPIER